MRISDVVARRADGVVRFSCRARHAVADAQWWFEVDDDGGPQPVGWCAPFLPAAAMVAGALGEDLEVEAPLDAVQVQGLEQAARRFQDWWGWTVPEVRQVGDPAAVAQPGPRGGRALLFSRGVDSSAELAAALLGQAPPVDLLVSVVGVDRFTSPAAGASHRSRTSATAAALDLPLRLVRTNLRDAVEGVVHWERSHGAVLVGAGLLAGGPPEALVVAQPLAAQFEADRDRPYGLRHDLVGCWSTATTSVEGGDAHLDRVDKTELVLRVPALTQSLRVCWEGGEAGNCGRCEKCLRTATVLLMLGRKDLVDLLFEHGLSAAQVRRLPRPDTTRPGALEEVLLRLRATVTESGDPELRELLDAWDEAANRAGNGAQAGLAGLDAAERLRACGPSPDGPPVVDLPPLGWGPGAVPLHLTRAERAAVPPVLEHEPARPVPWCQVDRLHPVAVRVAAELSVAVPGGSVVVVGPDCPTAPPWAVRRLLSSSTVRCWASAQPYLEAVPLLESLLAGCVPVQCADDVERVRAGLPGWARGLVRTPAEVGPLLADPEDLRRTWAAAVALAVEGTCERDAHLLGAGEQW